MDSKEGYKPLSNEDGGESGYSEMAPSRQSNCNSRKWTIGLAIVCILSMFMNIYSFAQRRIESSSENCVERTPYAKLARDKPIAWTWQSDYFSDDALADARKWNEINIDAGTIALTDEYVLTMGLPTSQRFPWDQNKGIYLTNGFHSLHCLKMLYLSVTEARDGLPQSTPFGHAQHCLDALRQEVICAADDTPRYTGFQPEKSSALGQRRQCRDWSQLERWTADNTACFRYINNTDPNFDTLERYKFCPEGSPYTERIEEIFGKVNLTL